MTNITWSDKVSGAGDSTGELSAADANEVKTAVNSKADQTALDTTNAAVALNTEKVSYPGPQDISGKQDIPAEGAFANGDKTKLDSIESNATADQTGAEIEALLDIELGGPGWKTPGGGAADDTPYDATSWDGNLDAPTKNAVRDKFESLSGAFPGFDTLQNDYGFDPASKQDDLDVPSQAEAEAGTATTERVWTAQRIAQAIAALAGGGTDDQNASEVPVTDSGDNYTGTNVETILAEIATILNSKQNTLTAASQAEMETGTEPGIRSMSPLRVAQAIAALAASLSFDEAGNYTLTGNWNFAAANVTLHSDVALDTDVTVANLVANDGSGDLANQSAFEAALGWVFAGGGAAGVTEVATLPGILVDDTLYAAIDTGDLTYKSTTGTYTLAGVYAADAATYSLTLDLEGVLAGDTVTVDGTPYSTDQVISGLSGSESITVAYGGTNSQITWTGTDGGDVTGSSPNFNINMNADKSIIGTFSAASGGNVVADAIVEFDAGTTAVPFIVAIYDNANNLLATSEQGTSAAGEVTVAITGGPTLVDATDYKVGIMVDAYGADILYNSGTGVAMEKDNTSATFPNPPDPSGANWDSSNTQLNIVLRNSSGTVLLGQLDGTDIETDLDFTSAVFVNTLTFTE